MLGQNLQNPERASFPVAPDFSRLPPIADIQQIRPWPRAFFHD
jgi:hypothetical protein